MASLVLGTVGAVVGGFLGGPTGAQIGWMIGSAVGSSFEPGTKNVGPKLSDLRVQSSTFGRHIPNIWGTVRTAGNIFYSSGLEEHSHTEKQGKGGGPKVTNETFTYSSSFAIAICKGEITGIRKIWADNKLIYDISEGNAGFIGKIQYKTRLYLGSKIQDVDPYMESKKGVGKTSAYRGIAYMFFEELDLTEFGNRIPNFEFEVVRSNSADKSKKLDYFTFNKVLDGDYSQGLRFNPHNKFVYGLRTNLVTSSIIIDKLDPVNKTVVSTESISFLCYTYGSSYEDMYINFNDDGDLLILGQIIDGINNTPKVLVVNADSLSHMFFDMGAFGERNLIIHPKMVRAITELYTVCTRANVGYSNATIYKFAGNGKPIGKTENKLSMYESSLFGGLYDYDISTDRYYFVSYEDNTHKNLWLSYLGPLGAIEQVFKIPNPTNRELYIEDVYFDSVGRNIFLNATNQSNDQPTLVIRINIDNFAVKTGVFGGVDNGLGVPKKRFNADSDDRRFITNISDQSIGYFKLCSFDWSSMTSTLIPFSVSDNDSIYPNNGSFCAFVPEIGADIWYGSKDNIYINSRISYLNNVLANLKATNTTNVGVENINDKNIALTQAHIDKLIALRDDTTKTFIFENFGVRISAGQYGLDQIIREVCLSSGLKDSDIDVTDLSSISVRGYATTNRHDARALIEQLATIFAFDGVESNNILKFKRRGSNSIATIKIDETSAQNYSTSMNFSKDISITRIQELELPKIANLLYLDIDKDHQQNNQQTTRVVKSSQNTLTYQIPVALSADEAKQTIDRLTYELWAKRQKFSFDTNMDYTHIEVADVITLRKKNVDYIVRIVKKTDSGDGILKFEAESELSTVYNQFGVGATGNLSSQTVDSLSTTKLQLLDMPILSESDNDAGIYAIANPSNRSLSWSGCSIFEAVDNQNYSNISSINGQNVIGATTEILGNFDGSNTLDISNSVVVNTSSSLSSISYDELLNGGNIALIGNELIQFMNATLIGPNIFRLSKILRGRFGTEAQIANHISNERFIKFNLGTGAVKRLLKDSSNFNINVYLKGVTYGTLVEDSIAIKLNNKSIGLKPYPVCHVQRYRQSNDIYINWISRVRGLGLLKDYVDVYDLDGDSYEIDILRNDGTVARTISVSLASTIYQSSQQIIDFGSVQSNVNINIYKINSVVGRGYPLSIAI